ncbi:mannose-P-dolichol utilization defect 1 protein [Sphaerulina musiva SO2202]|uniref:Mannose-P-dolichol utilization defect 1 protein homolog n=1 Tax=Sphaerulina musiva (strain SO2202) TaxID=692275 RepID=N1QHQ1_SPHMS|nr:mannose-P-dolichol utilization defect 1 protein [Sphaerulina musiva SO2202]EMF16766.1 mannose-P-dolichol utilization defect 1 protein [Sphaerulina musiva SO2202]
MEALETTLRGILTPITRNLPQPISDAATQLLGDSCYRSLVHNITISDTVCLKLAISKALGIAIIGASSIVKIPQLLKLINSQSADGISFLSYLLETVSYLVTLVYNVRNQFPFSTYGETALIAVQNVAISVLVLQYSGKAPAAAVFVGGLAAAGYALYNESVVSMAQLQYFQAGAGLLGVASKLPQIVTIFSQGGTGQLSAFAIFNYLAGSLARIFTTLQEVDDKLILYGFLAGFSLNLVLALQMIYYWNSPSTKHQEKLTPTKAGAPSYANVVKASGSQRQKNSPSTRRRG